MDEQEDNFQENETTEQPKPNRFGALKVLIPTKEYFITPIIINLNILVFLAMVISGVSAWLPTGNDILAWGANFRPLTLQQPWRLFTCMFVHIGILHIFVNMFSLISLGRLLEQFIGRWRFLILYILTGLCGSIVSTWWHIAPAAGASGAIFGLFGVFVAIVTTNIIEPVSRKKMMRGIVTTIILNAAISLWAGIDTAAHLGGFLSGMIGGYLIYFDLKAFYLRRIKQVTGIIMATVVLCGIIFLFWKLIPEPIVAGESDVDVYFERYDNERQAAFNFVNTMDSTVTLDQIQKNYSKHWDNCLSVLDTVRSMRIPAEAEAYVDSLRKVTLWGKQSAIYYERSVKEHRNDLKDSGTVMLKKHNSEFEALEKSMQGDQ